MHFEPRILLIRVVLLHRTPSCRNGRTLKSQAALPSPPSPQSIDETAVHNAPNHRIEAAVIAHFNYRDVLQPLERLRKDVRQRVTLTQIRNLRVRAAAAVRPPRHNCQAVEIQTRVAERKPRPGLVQRTEVANPRRERQTPDCADLGMA